LGSAQNNSKGISKTTSHGTKQSLLAHGESRKTFWALLKTTAKAYARQQTMGQNKANQLRARTGDVLGSTPKQQKPKQNKQRVITRNKNAK